MSGRSKWTIEELKLAEDGWHKGWTASYIAACLNIPRYEKSGEMPFTRSSVLGQVYRLGWKRSSKAA